MPSGFKAMRNAGKNMALSSRVIEEIIKNRAAYVLEDHVWTPCSPGEPRKTSIQWDWGYTEWIKTVSPIAAFEKGILEEVLRSVQERAADAKDQRQHRITKLAQEIPSLKLVSEL